MGDASTDAFEDDRIAPDASSGEGSPTSDDVTTFGSCPSDVLCSPFVLISLVFNLITTFGMSALVFSILFIFLGDPTYEWYSMNVIGVIVFGSVYLEPMLLMALAPVTMIDANIKGFALLLECGVAESMLLPYFSSSQIDQLLKANVISLHSNGTCSFQARYIERFFERRFLGSDKRD